MQSTYSVEGYRGDKTNDYYDDEGNVNISSMVEVRRYTQLLSHRDLVIS